MFSLKFSLDVAVHLSPWLVFFQLLPIRYCGSHRQPSQHHNASSELKPQLISVPHNFLITFLIHVFPHKFETLQYLSLSLLLSSVPPDLWHCFKIYSAAIKRQQLSKDPQDNLIQLQRNPRENLMHLQRNTAK